MVTIHPSPDSPKPNTPDPAPPAPVKAPAPSSSDVLSLLTVPEFPNGAPALRESPATSLSTDTVSPPVNETGITPSEKPLTTDVSSRFLDKLGITLSAVCAIKCIGVPIIAAALSLGGLATVAHHPVVVWTVAGLALPVAGWRLVVRELRRGRLVTPAAAILAGGWLTVGAIGTTLPASSAAAARAGHCCGGTSAEAAEEPSSGAISEHAGHGSGDGGATPAESGGRLSLYEAVRANGHAALRFGAIALGLLHINLLLSDRRERKSKGAGACGKSGSECGCPE